MKYLVILASLFLFGCTPTDHELVQRLAQYNIKKERCEDLAKKTAHNYCDFGLCYEVEILGFMDGFCVFGESGKPVNSEMERLINYAYKNGMEDQSQKEKTKP